MFHTLSHSRTQGLLDDESGGSDAALSALGAALSFLRSGLLDAAVLPTCRPETLPPAGGDAAAGAGGSSAAQGPQHMRMDGAALQNLEVSRLFHVFGFSYALRKRITK